jgi:hypothetical protein
MQQRINYNLEYNTIKKTTNNMEIGETYIGVEETNRFGVYFIF